MLVDAWAGKGQEWGGVGREGETGRVRVGGGNIETEKKG